MNWTISLYSVKTTSESINVMSDGYSQKDYDKTQTWF